MSHFNSVVSPGGLQHQEESQERNPIHGQGLSDQGDREDLRGQQGTHRKALQQTERGASGSTAYLPRFQAVEVPLCSGYFRLGSCTRRKTGASPDRGDVASHDSVSAVRMCRLRRELYEYNNKPHIMRGLIAMFSEYMKKYFIWILGNQNVLSARQSNILISFLNANAESNRNL